MLAILKAALELESMFQMFQKQWHVVHNAEFWLHVCKSTTNISLKYKVQGFKS